MVPIFKFSWYNVYKFYAKPGSKERILKMNNDVCNYVVEKTQELKNAPTCSSETKAAAEAWLEALGTEREASETKKYIEELEADIMPIDTLIAFSESDNGIQYFGAGAAGEIAAHAKAIKADGAQFCDCPACNAVAAILEKKELLLA